MKNILVYFLENKVEPCITDFLNYLYDFYRLDRPHIKAFFQEYFHLTLTIHTPSIYHYYYLLAIFKNCTSVRISSISILLLKKT